MAHHAQEPQAQQPRPYQPGRTLGRNGSQPDTESQLVDRVTQLDALAVLLSSPAAEDGLNDFQRYNASVQLELLGLLSSLAMDAHELLQQHLVSSRATGAASASRGVGS